MSTMLRASEVRIAHARQALTLHRRLAATLVKSSDDHRKAMELVFLCEDTLCLLIETHAMMTRLDKGREAKDWHNFSATTKDAAGAAACPRT